MLWLSFDCCEDTFFGDEILDCRVHPVYNSDLREMKKAYYHMQHNVEYFRNRHHSQLPLSWFSKTRPKTVRHLLSRIHSFQSHYTVRL